MDNPNLLETIQHMSSQNTALFRFGLISDIQYADIDDAMNFSKTEQRTYRGGIEHTRSAVQYWNNMLPQPLFIMQLGDIIDGQNSGTYGQGLKMKDPQSLSALHSITDEFDQSQIAVHHIVGNHELYNFDWLQLKAKLNRQQQCIAQDKFYYSFVCATGWRCVVLNSYAISTMQHKESDGYQQAHAILAKKNKNFLGQGKKDYFEGLEGLERRFGPFNGGLGTEQIQWLKATIELSIAQNERVLVFVHNPLYELAASSKNLAFDYDIVLDILHNTPKGHIVGVFAGHYHNGGYAQDDHGIHHITIKAPLTHGKCFAYVDVFESRMHCVGQGAQPSFDCPF